jgi:hypothetical protein
MAEAGFPPQAGALSGGRRPARVARTVDTGVVGRSVVWTAREWETEDDFGLLRNANFWIDQSIQRIRWTWYNSRYKNRPFFFWKSLESVQI